MDSVAPVLYAELRRIAAAKLRAERAGHTLDPTALVNEAFVRLLSTHGVSWQSRGHFFAFASSLMRRILVDYGRRRSAVKRSISRLVPDATGWAGYRSGENLVALDEALTELERGDARKARVIEMRYFGGMSGEDIAAAMGVGTATVTRDLRVAEAWLRSFMTSSGGVARV